MATRAEIESLIDETEAKYRECWATLVRIKESFTSVKEWKESEAADFLEDLLSFQPTLGRALLELSEMYRVLQQEKYKIIAKKDRLSPEWFRHRLALLSRYQENLKTTMSIGKCLGDSFAWFFYQGERRYLPEHYNHQMQLQAPPGIGGRGEVEFIDKVRVLKGHFVLHHGITTFLRLGDVSFIDLRSLELAAIGELKSKQIVDGKLDMTVSVIGPKKEAMLLFEGAEVGPRHIDEEPPPLSQSTRAKLNKQLASIGELFSLPGPERTLGGQDFRGYGHGNELETLWGELKTSTSAFRKIGDGLILMGLRNRKRTLSSRLMTPYSRHDLDKKLQGIEEEVQRTILEGSDDNYVWIDSFHTPEPEYQLMPGMTPPFSVARRSRLC